MLQIVHESVATFRIPGLSLDLGNEHMLKI